MMQIKKSLREIALPMIITACSMSGALASEADVTLAPLAEPERWNAHFQSTYILQTKDPMHAPYSGANSLLPGREYGWSYSATAAFGLRLWQGGELYFDPEVIAAVS